MARVRVQKVPSQANSLKKRDLYALVCYHYPQYTLKEAAELPYRDVRLLLKTAQRQDATKMYYLTQIQAAPHTKKMKGIKQISEFFKKLASDN